jgi:Rod binding domain-containing protein
MQINTINANLATANRAEIPAASQKEQMEKAAAEFEGFFVYQMLEQTQPEVDLDSEFMGGNVEQTFRPFLNQYLAEEMVEAGGFGLKENIIKQMEKYQEVQGYGR